MSDATARPDSRPRRSLFDALPAGVAAATVAGWCGRWHWMLDLANHFRWYILALATVWLVATFRRTGPLAKACLTVAILGNAWAMLPYWLPTSAPASAAADGPDAVSFVSVNVLTSNRDVDRAIDYLRGRRADLVAVLEVDDRWAAALGALADSHPHRLVRPRDDNFGIALLSRLPLEDARTVDFGDTGLPTIVARVRREAGDFLVIATHPVPPKGSVYARDRDAQLRAIADFVAAAPLPCVVLGDFNATPWSTAFIDFTARSGLRDTALGRGIQPTWNARVWLPRIPIDHILAPPAATVLRRAVGPDIGSDHFPVEAELVLPAR